MFFNVERFSFSSEPISPDLIATFLQTLPTVRNLRTRGAGTTPDQMYAIMN